MIAGVATETMVESTRIMKNPMIMAHKAGHGLRPSGWPWGPSAWDLAAPVATLVVSRSSAAAAGRLKAIVPVALLASASISRP